MQPRPYGACMVLPLHERNINFVFMEEIISLFVFMQEISIYIHILIILAPVHICLSMTRCAVCEVAVIVPAINTLSFWLVCMLRLLWCTGGRGGRGGTFATIWRRTVCVQKKRERERELVIV
jgi:hypothetical protein